jgi:hypothetical protein
MKNYWTKKECEEIINQYKDNTAYFGNFADEKPMEFHRMYNMLRYQMQFGEAETMVIIASLIKAGGKII